MPSKSVLIRGDSAAIDGIIGELDLSATSCSRCVCSGSRSRRDNAERCSLGTNPIQDIEAEAEPDRASCQGKIKDRSSRCPKRARSHGKV
jgi:hypothetical protein